jgi:hypothetical protein
LAFATSCFVFLAMVRAALLQRTGRSSSSCRWSWLQSCRCW